MFFELKPTTRLAFPPAGVIFKRFEDAPSCRGFFGRRWKKASHQLECIQRCHSWYTLSFQQPCVVIQIDTRGRCRYCRQETLENGRMVGVRVELRTEPTGRASVAATSTSNSYNGLGRVIPNPPWTRYASHPWRMVARVLTSFLELAFSMLRVGRRGAQPEPCHRHGPHKGASRVSAPHVRPHRHHGPPNSLAGLQKGSLSGPPILAQIMALTEMGHSAFSLMDVRQTKIYHADLSDLRPCGA